MEKTAFRVTVEGTSCERESRDLSGNEEKKKIYCQFSRFMYIFYSRYAAQPGRIKRERKGDACKEDREEGARRMSVRKTERRCVRRGLGVTGKIVLLSASIFFVFK